MTLQATLADMQTLKRTVMELTSNISQLNVKLSSQSQASQLPPQQEDKKTKSPSKLPTNLPLEQLNGGSYYFSEAQMSWYDAREFCKSNGLDLASFETTTEWDKLIPAIVRLINKFANYPWTSATNEGGTWTWQATGKPMTLTNLPSYYTPEKRTHCLYITNELIYGTACNRALPFICEFYTNN